MKITDKISNLIRKVCGRGPRHSALGTSVALGSLIAIATTSCSMINEDLEPCAPAPNTITTVNFVYDYNMMEQDLFDDHVGSVYLYVFNSKGIFQFRQSAHKADMNGGIDFSMQFDTTYMHPGHTYQLVAVAQGNHMGYDASLDTPGFTLQTDMVPGESTIEDYRIKLDRDDDGTYDFGVVNFKDAYGNNSEMIDTVWTTKPDEVQIAKIPYIEYKPQAQKLPDNEVTVTIPMMRITNSITINLIADNFTQETDPDDYMFLIDFPNGNGTIDFTGTTYPYQELFYRSLRKKVIEYDSKKVGDAYVPESENPDTKTRADDEKVYAIQALFGVSRLQVTDDSSLQIRDPKTNEIIAQIDNFSSFLAEYFEHAYDDQEFLDREYDFQVDIALKDNNIYWIQCGCSILGWAKRIYFYDLS